MRELGFRSPDGRDVEPEEWLRLWSGRFPVNYYAGYHELIVKGELLSGKDFERIGRWKDGARTEGRWKPNVAMVAYDIWMQAASEMPKCPAEDLVAGFLENWSERTYRNEYSGLVQQKRFGLSRATTLLHFISGGRYPIFDSRVRRAVTRLLESPARNTVRWYLDSYCEIFYEIAEACHTKDLRAVDMALFSYGDRVLQFAN
jgi:hypothetical protein